MSRADSGGFDLVFELSISALRQRLEPLIGAPIPDATMAMNGWGTISFHSEIALTDLSLEPDATVHAAVSGSVTMTWPALVSFGVQVFGPGSQTLAATIGVRATPEAAGTSLSLAFATDAIYLELAPGSLEAIPAIAAWLATISFWQGNGAMEAERERLYDETERALVGGLNASLPASVAIGTLPSPPVGSVEIVAVRQELRVLMMIGGDRSQADPAAITRSALGPRRSGGVFRPGDDGASTDVAAIIVGNHCLLRDILRPILRSGLGLTESGFLGSHPCFWVGSDAMPAAATVSGIRPRMKVVHAGIDGNGLVHVRVSFEGTHSSGAFGLEGSIDLSFGVSVRPARNGGRTLTVTVGTSLVTDFDMWVSPWVYAIGLTVNAPLLTLVIAFSDAFAGGALANTINGAIRAAVGNGRLAMPLPAGPIGVSSLRSAQSDADAQTIDFLMHSLSDFPANDVIVRIG